MEGYQQLRDRLIAAPGIPERAASEQVSQAAYEALGRASSAVVVANLEDALAVKQRPNMPGTLDQWPNWSQALPVAIEDFPDMPLPGKIARALSREQE